MEFNPIGEDNISWCGFCYQYNAKDINSYPLGFHSLSIYHMSGYTVLWERTPYPIDSISLAYLSGSDMNGWWRTQVMCKYPSVKSVLILDLRAIHYPFRYSFGIHLWDLPLGWFLWSHLDAMAYQNHRWRRTSVQYEPHGDWSARARKVLKYPWWWPRMHTVHLPRWQGL